MQRARTLQVHGPSGTLLFTNTISAVVKLPAGCEALFVHILWVNTKARQFYEAQDFYIDMEESANTAHYRGHCLEGVEGRGRTILLRYDLTERERRQGKHRIV